MNNNEPVKFEHHMNCTMQATVKTFSASKDSSYFTFHIAKFSNVNIRLIPNHFEILHLKITIMKLESVEVLPFIKGKKIFYLMSSN